MALLAVKRESVKDSDTCVSFDGRDGRVYAWVPTEQLQVAYGMAANQHQTYLRVHQTDQRLMTIEGEHVVLILLPETKARPRARCWIAEKAIASGAQAKTVAEISAEVTEKGHEISRLEKQLSKARDEMTQLLLLRAASEEAGAIHPVH
jgi:uncharacterized coiled-coil protein SlyX